MRRQSNHKACRNHIGYMIKIKLFGGDVSKREREINALPGSREGEGFCGLNGARIYSGIPERRVWFLVVWHVG